MTNIGEIERRTQARVVDLFREQLGYRYLGNWEKREGNRNIEDDLLRAFLCHQPGCDEALITRAIGALHRAADDTSKSLYDRNRAVYGLLRYGVKLKPEVGENTQTVWLIDWEQPQRNDFAVAEEVAVAAGDAKAFGKRPDVVLYVNGIALGVLELKRSTVSVAEGIRQNLDNQKRLFIEHFFATVQWIMAGNNTEGLRYGAIETAEKYYLTWKEDSAVQNPLERALLQLCSKERLLELIHDFVVFDTGVKKLCRHNQYFGVRAAQQRVQRRVGGIIWHTQGSGKSLTMVWLAKWIREHVPDARVLIITDRIELDEQIEGVFLGVGEQIYRTRSGADLVTTLNATLHWLVCSLIHKFGGKEDGEAVGDIPGYVAELRKALPPGFAPKGNLVVFVDECHRTQSGDLHEAMKAMLPGAIFVGFTGTPLLKADKQRSIEVFGGYIHTYKFDEAVRDGVVVDLRYEARDIDQRLTSQDKIDQWFEAKTRGLTDIAKAQLKARWGTMQKVLSSKSRLDQIVNDIMMDMETRPRLMSRRGNAMLVSGSIYEACQFYAAFAKTELQGKCAIVTSYRPGAAEIKGEDSGEGENEELAQFEIYRQMLADWFRQPSEQAVNRADEFEEQVKEKFIKEPGQMRLLIVVDKLLTGFDAPPATYLYIDKEIRDHGLFQAICRVNRLDGEDKDYGYIIDYKDLFRSLESAVHDYTSGALDAYDKEDVAGLLEDRLSKASDRLYETREAVRAVCEPVAPPRDLMAYLHYFCAVESGNAEQLKANEQRRLSLYKHVAAFVRAYANIANEMPEAGFSSIEVTQFDLEVKHRVNLRDEVKRASGDAIDLKAYEPAMRHLIDAYIQADPSRSLPGFDDMSLVQLIVERGVDGIDALPPEIKKNKEAVAKTIENNVRRLIIDEEPINPKYYEKMSRLLDALIEQRRRAALAYEEYLRQIVELTRQVKDPGKGSDYPATLDTAAKRALYDNLGRNAHLAVIMDDAVRNSMQDDWRANVFKTRKVRNAIRAVLRVASEDGRGPVGEVGMSDKGLEWTALDEETERILELVKNQHDY